MPALPQTIEEQLHIAQESISAVYKQLFEIKSGREENLGDLNNAHYSVPRIRDYCNDIVDMLKELKLSANND